MHRALSAPADLPGKAKVMRSLGLSEAAIQAAFDVDWPRTATATNADPVCPPRAVSTPLPCPGGILKCPAEGGWIGKSGAVGDGWVGSQLTTQSYTCSTATTGAGSFGALAAVLRGAADCDGALTNCSMEANVAEAVSFKAARFLASSIDKITGWVTGHNFDGETFNHSSMGGVAYITDGIMQAEILGFTAGDKSSAESMRMMALDVAREITDIGCAPGVHS